MQRTNFILLTMLLLPVATLVTSCEKFRRQIKTEMHRGREAKIRVSNCCWCVDANTNANVVSNYISPKFCEQMVDDPTKSLTKCKSVKVDSERCSFQTLTEGQSSLPSDPSLQVQQKRPMNDLKIHGTEDQFITALTPQPTHCDRHLTTANGLSESSDPRCAVETCSCYADPNLPWNCELVILRKDGKKESLGQRTKLDREHGCDATSCKDLFAREVRAFCPTFK